MNQVLTLGELDHLLAGASPSVSTEVLHAGTESEALQCSRDGRVVAHAGVVDGWFEIEGDESHSSTQDVRQAAQIIADL